MLFSMKQIYPQILFFFKNRPALQLQTHTNTMDRHKEKEAEGEKETMMAHFSEETLKLCVHTANSSCVAIMYS